MKISPVTNLPRSIQAASAVASSSRVLVTPFQARYVESKWGISRSTIAARPGARIGSSTRRYATEAAGSNPPPGVEDMIPPISAEDTYDIVIIGGGNAGLALACALLAKPSLKATSRVLLLEGGSLDRVRNWTGKGDWENRVSSLTAENIDWLDSIGVWKHIEESRSCPVDEMVIWANPSPKSAPTIHFPPLDHPMARMTENTNLQRALLRRIEEVGKGSVEIREGGRVGEMKYGEGGRWVGLKIGDTWVRGGVVVGADGPNSPVRQFSQTSTQGYPYPTHALVATLHHPRPPYPNNTAYQRFLPTGPLAFLPLSPEASTMVWSTTPELCAAYKKLTVEALVIMVNAGYTLPENVLEKVNEVVLKSTLTPEQLTNLIASLSTDTISEIPPFLPPTTTSIAPKSIASFPLRLSHAETYTSGRTVLVGDAAHTTHPLAGQGLNMGLADVRSLSDVFEKARLSGGDLGSLTVLQHYGRERYGANMAILGVTDMLNRVFKTRNGLVNWGRGLGLEVINELDWVKRILMGGAGAKAGGKNVGGGEGRGWDKVANGLEGWFAVKGVLGMAGEVVAGAVKNGLGSMGRR